MNKKTLMSVTAFLVCALNTHAQDDAFEENLLVDIYNGNVEISASLPTVEASEKYFFVQIENRKILAVYKSKSMNLDTIQSYVDMLSKRLPAFGRVYVVHSENGKNKRTSYFHVHNKMVKMNFLMKRESIVEVSMPEEYFQELIGKPEAKGILERPPQKLDRK